MKNKELINKIQSKFKGEKMKLKKPLFINFDVNDTDKMTEMIMDEGELCVSSNTWVLPLSEMTNKELVQLRKCV